VPGYDRHPVLGREWQRRAGSLYPSLLDCDADIGSQRVAVQQGWMSGYTDSSFRSDTTVTLEEACAAVLNLLGYDVTTLRGTFPTAQLNKANELGLRDDLPCTQGEILTVEQGAQLLYNALTVQNADGQLYADTLGITITDGRADVSSILMGNLKGPFVAA